MEVAFDTSEETDFSVPHYFKDDPKNKPELGVVFDSTWCVAYEKGIERPVFRVPLGRISGGEGPRLKSLNTFPGPTNQIADSASVVIEAKDAASAGEFRTFADREYEEYDFGNVYYRKADMSSTLEGRTVTLKTMVSGAQHGSGPHENRIRGANPLVSLAVFLTHLMDSGKVNGDNGIGRMVRFMDWAWGIRVFGEGHPDLLEAHDGIFKKGNGTTYALTKFVTDEAKNEARLEVDIRYALGHHGKKWDGTTWGTIEGDSRFEGIFSVLTGMFNTIHPGRGVQFQTRTLVGPDLKDENGPAFQKVNRAFRDVTGYDCPVIAEGGGTDAKGYPELIAAGTLFTPRLGEPVNFHGIDEAAPVIDLKKGVRILYSLLLNEVEANRR